MSQAPTSDQVVSVGGGDCYQAAANLQIRFGHTALLCHGTVTGTGGEVKGQRFGHAWVEFCGVVHDRSNGNDVMIRPEVYYRIGQIDPDEVVRYDWEQAAIHMLRTAHYGPWDEEDV